jgi:hypothetical protein
MKTYTKSTRNSQDVYSCFEGMSETTVRNLMESIGHTDITVITESTYIASIPAI